MDVLRFGEPNNFWNAPAYSLKVRGRRYLWGSASLTLNVSFEDALILHIANDQAGEPVSIGTRVAAGTATDWGTLQPGECVSIPLNEVTGIYAECILDSIVHCLIR